MAKNNLLLGATADVRLPLEKSARDDLERVVRYSEHASLTTFLGALARMMGGIERPFCLHEVIHVPEELKASGKPIADDGNDASPDTL